MPAPVHIVPLGGLGEIGMNCMAIESDGHVALIDCGIMFSNEAIGVDLIAPDFSWLLERRERLGAIFLTHGHEDHIGALSTLLRQLRRPVPIYGARFTLALAKSRLAESQIDADLREIEPRDLRASGPFEAEFLAVTHSIPDACGIALQTPQGLMLHTGDFKIDESPIDGRAMDLERIAELGARGIRCLLSDSTNSEREGTSLPESAVQPAFRDAFARATGRIFVACFSSNIHRVAQVFAAAAAVSRHVTPIGRSMEQNVRLAMELGYLKVPGWQLVAADDLRHLKPSEVTLLVTGTQGEPRSALARLARGDFPNASIDRGDLVILSSRFIPGNEVAIGEVVNNLARRGAEVVIETPGQPVHVSGHAQAGEQRRVIALAKPNIFVPIHGEFRHLVRHSSTAAMEGIPEARRPIAVDGDILAITDRGASIAEERAAVGRVYLSRSGIEVGPEVLDDRRYLAEAGVVAAVLVVSASDHRVLRGPDFLAKGIAGWEDRHPRVRGEVERTLAEMPALPMGVPELEELLRSAIRRSFRKEGERRPAVLPIILEV